MIRRRSDRRRGWRSSGEFERTLGELRQRWLRETERYLAKCGRSENRMKARARRAIAAARHAAVGFLSSPGVQVACLVIREIAAYLDEMNFAGCGRVVEPMLMRGGRDDHQDRQQQRAERASGELHHAIFLLAGTLGARRNRVNLVHPLFTSALEAGSTASSSSPLHVAVHDLDEMACEARSLPSRWPTATEQVSRMRANCGERHRPRKGHIPYDGSNASDA
jgi:hypothetical protein